MKAKKGFTLVELSMSIIFISVLLIGIASLVIHMTSMYQKGLTLRAINASGQQIIEDITRAVNGASYVVDVSKADDNGDGYIDDVENKKAIKTYFYESKAGDEQKYGALCISDYTYIWNARISLYNQVNGKMDEDSYNGVWISNDGGDSYQRYRFARIPDPAHVQCDASIEGSLAYEGGDERVEIVIDTVTEPVELIEKDEIDLAIYHFTVTPATQSVATKQAFLSASFIVATLRGGVNIMANGDYCMGDMAYTGVESDFSREDFNYCAVNKFNFSMRTGGNANRKG